MSNGSINRDMSEYINGWYVFSCRPQPVRIKIGLLPNPPYKRFNTEDEANQYIELRNKKRYDR